MGGKKEASTGSSIVKLRKAWERLKGVPLGTRLFSAIFGKLVPYSGSIHPHILELRPGYAKIEMRDRRALRNHLNSVHAVALMNLGEMVTGLAMTLALPDRCRAIVTDLSMQYHKKARGTMTAVCEAKLPEGVLETGDRDCVVEGKILDAEGNLVAASKATWRIRTS